MGTGLQVQNGKIKIKKSKKNLKEKTKTKKKEEEEHIFLVKDGLLQITIPSVLVVSLMFKVPVQNKCREILRFTYEWMVVNNKKKYLLTNKSVLWVEAIWMKTWGRQIRWIFFLCFFKDLFVYHIDKLGTR